MKKSSPILFIVFCALVLMGQTFPTPTFGPGYKFARISKLDCSIDVSSQLQSEANSGGAGNTLVLPAGCLLVNSTVTPPNGQHLVGMGNVPQPDTSGTLILTTITTETPIIALNGNGASVENMSFKNTTSAASNTPLANSFAIAIQQAPSGNPQKQLIRNVSVFGYNVGIEVLNGYFWTHDAIYIDSSRSYNLYVNNFANADQGDWSLINSTLVNCAKCLRYEGGGGGKIANTKILSGVTGIDVVTTSNTSDFAVASTVSVENFSGPAISLVATGSGYFSNITLEPQINTNSDAISIGTSIGLVSVPSSAHIYSVSGHGVVVNGNGGTQQINLSPSIDHVGLSAIQILGGNQINYDTRFISVDQTSGGATLVEDTRTGARSGNESNVVRYGVSPKNLTSDTVYSNLASIQMPILSGLTLSLDFNGVVAGVDATGFSKKLMFRRGASGAAALVATPYDTGVSGASIDFQVDASATDGTIALNMKRHTATGTSIAGNLAIEVKGAVAKFTVSNSNGP